MTTTIPDVLTATANQILAIVAPNTARLVHAHVTLDEDADTAATDGLRIWVPPIFEGVDVAQDTPVAVGLLVHELGHFLQPLKAVAEICERTGCPQWLANVYLDVQLEALMAGLFPPLANTLSAVRAAVNRTRAAEYLAAVRQAMSLKEAACPLALLGRFGMPDHAFNGTPAQTGAGSAWIAANELAGREALRARAYLDRLAGALEVSGAELPERLEKLIAEFPELRDAPAPFQAPSDQLRSAGAEGDARAAALQAEASQNVAGQQPEALEPLRKLSAFPQPASADVQQAARGLRVHFQVRRGASEIVAPQRLDRRAAALDEPVPFRMTLPGRAVPAPRLVICLDKSGSMRGAKFTLAQAAAQAVALAVREAQGEVIGVLFDDAGYLAVNPKLPDDLLFARADQLGGFGGTDFTCLLHIWRQWPEHQVLLVTDGDGALPAAMPGDKARTSALLIPPDCDEAAMAQICARTVTVTDLASLANIMALLTPRR